MEPTISFLSMYLIDILPTWNCISAVYLEVQLLLKNFKYKIKVSSSISDFRLQLSHLKVVVFWSSIRLLGTKLFIP